MLDSLVAVVVVVLVVAGITVMIRRRGGDEVHSVEGYRSTLHTLETVRSRSSAVRVLPRAGEAPEAGEAPAAPPGADGPGAGESLGAVAAGGAAYEFSDDADDDADPSRFLRDTPRQRRRALSAMNHGPRRFVAPVLAGIVVLGAVAALAVVGARTHRTPSGATTTTTSRSAHDASSQHTTTTAPGHDRHATRQRHATTTTTTAPPTYTAVTSTATTATYVPPEPSYVIRLTATTGACWVQVTNQQTGNVEFTQTMAAGTAQSVSVKGTTLVELGAPSAATVTLDNTPVVLPSGHGSPFTLTFAPPPGAG